MDSQRSPQTPTPDMPGVVPVPASDYVLGVTEWLPDRVALAEGRAYQSAMAVRVGHDPDTGQPLTPDTLGRALGCLALNNKIVATYDPALVIWIGGV